MPLPIPILGGLISAGSNIVDSVSQGITNRANRKWSEKMYGIQRQDALSDFNAQNLYNSPGEQMKRLKAAGLNPNLVYGTGAATSAASPVRGSSAPTGVARSAAPNLGAAITTYMQLRQNDSQIDLQKTQQLVNLVETVLKDKQAANVSADTDIKRFDLGLKSDIRDISVQAAAASLNKTLAETGVMLDGNSRENMLFSPRFSKALLDVAAQEIANTKSKVEISEIQTRIKNILADTRIKNLDADLKDKGIQPHDSALMRGIQQWLKSPDGMTDALMDEIRRITGGKLGGVK